MRLWVPLLLAPVLALLDQVVAFGVVGWSCAHERAIVVHAIHASFLVAAALTLVPAWRIWRSSRARADEAGRRQHFLGNIALASAAMSVLVIAAMWLTVWFVAPCVA